MVSDNCDIAIIGSGLTGISAAVAAYAGNPDLTIKLFGIPFDSNTAKKGEIENIPGINKVVGVDFIQQLVDQVESLNTEFTQNEKTGSALEITHEMVKSVSRKEKGFVVTTEEKSVEANAIIISTGLPELKHTIKGEDDFVHKGVSHCAVCDGALYRGKRVAIIGKGNFAARGALFLRK
ncbi:MAG: NAD(P)/FAD-dependent oxidoreductase [Candidatus Heimdallarchaeaceae archaeon]|jgi:thioredoxin reductase (NADPH)